MAPDFDRKNKNSRQVSRTRWLRLGASIIDQQQMIGRNLDQFGVRAGLPSPRLVLGDPEGCVRCPTVVMLRDVHRLPGLSRGVFGEPKSDPGSTGGQGKRAVFCAQQTGLDAIGGYRVG